MNESIRTVVFVAVSAVVALGAYVTKPRLAPVGTTVGGIKAGDPLFADFKDPLAARSLEIKQFDESLAKVTSFIVNQQADGRWTLASHGNYPADAESQLKAVAEIFADLRVVGDATDDKSEHELYGVNDPDKAEVGMKGVGTLIAMQDGKGNDLLRMVVGKEVQNATNQRFVRKPGQDHVFVTTIDMTKLPTEFEKWIEKDLLKLTTFDVNRVILKDYLVMPAGRGQLQLVQRSESDLTYDNAKGEWKPAKLLTFSGRDTKETPLGPMEELNKQKLDDLRNALGDLKIVDVRKKPEGLGNSLRVSADKLPIDQQSDLQKLGFYPYSGSGSSSLEIYGAHGEVIVETKDGVQYVLRFGEIKPTTATPTSTSKSSSTKSGSEDEVKVNRYLFVTTQLAPSVLAPPQLEPEPAGPEPTADAAKKADEAAKSDDAKKKDEEKAATIDPQQAERERIKRENERKMNAYRDLKTKADSRVKELNGRFADWYYVVAEDVYKKIRLTRSDIVKEAAAAKEEGFGIDAFRKLEEEGVKGAPPTKTISPTPSSALPSIP